MKQWCEFDSAVCVCFTEKPVEVTKNVNLSNDSKSPAGNLSALQINKLLTVRYCL